MIEIEQRARAVFKELYMREPMQDAWEIDNARLEFLAQFLRDERRRFAEEVIVQFNNNRVKIVQEEPSYDFVTWCRQQAEEEKS